MEIRLREKTEQETSIKTQALQEDCSISSGPSPVPRYQREWKWGGGRQGTETFSQMHLLRALL